MFTNHFTKQRHLIAYLLLTICYSLSAQTKRPEEPQFKDFEPVNIFPSGTTSSESSSKTNTSSAPTSPINQNAKMGGHAQDILNRVNSRLDDDLGNNKPERLQRAIAKSEELREIYEDDRAEKNRKFHSEYYTSPNFIEQTKPYEKAFSAINDMLTGKKPLSIKDAYYVMESAYGNTYISYEEYIKNIKQSAEYIKMWLLQYGLNPRDKDALQLGIQKFMGDTLVIEMVNPDTKGAAKKMTHFPFFYDYNDFKAEQDYRNYFVTKTFATLSGQCNSLPAVYLILAEALGTKAYLSFAPYHSFVKYTNKNGIIHNYEPTSNWNITDKWYQDHMFISPEAKRSGIYLDTLNKKQIVANCLVDLASGYMNKFGATDGEFAKKCIKTSIEYFPKRNNIYAYFVYSSAIQWQLRKVMYFNDIKNINDIPQNAQALTLYELLLRNEETIKELGYQEQPKRLYDEIMKSQEFKGQQQNKNVSSKEKRNAFIESN